MRSYLVGPLATEYGYSRAYRFDEQANNPVHDADIFLLNRNCGCCVSGTIRLQLCHHFSAPIAIVHLSIELQWHPTLTHLSPPAAKAKALS
jgi:hypothetical protein